MHVWAWYHFRAGRAALERYHSVDAIEHLQATLSVWRHDPDTLVLSARAARRLEAFDQADEFLQKAKGMRGKHADPTLERLLLRAARGELEEVGKTCQAMVERGDPASSLILEALVHGALRKFRLRYADNLLHRWRESEPDNPQVAYMTGLLFEYMGVRQEAALQFRRALELDPEHEEARERLAVQLLDLLRAHEAIPHLEYLRDRRPDNWRIPVLLAQCKDQMGQLAEAEAILDSLLEREPNYPPALAERGKMALRDGRVQDAEQWLVKATNLEPGDYSVHYMLFQCLVQNGKAKEAAEIQKRLKQIEDDITRLRDIIGTKMQQSPQDVALHYELGMIAMRAGSYRDALRWFESALKIEPRHAPTHRALSEYYQRTGQLGMAQRHWQAAKAADPEGMTNKEPPAAPER
jgi:tetratricopeptide (TPR) repeat protein